MTGTRHRTAETMARAEASVAQPPPVSPPEPVDREKEFFRTWLRLMERHKDMKDLTQALQSSLAETTDNTAKLQDIQHQANMLSANEKTISELEVQINDFFFRDIVPALNRAKQVSPATQASPQQMDDPLDRYLQQGDEDTAMPQAFVDDMSGWAAPGEESNSQQKKKKQQLRGISQTLQAVGGDGEDSAESEDEGVTDDEIPSDTFHDLLIANSLKLTAMQAPGYSAVAQMHAMQAVATVNRGAAGDQASATSCASPRGRAKIKTSKRGRMIPPPIVTDLPPRSGSASRSTPSTQSWSPVEAAQNKYRMGKRAAASLIAEQVLGVRTYGSVKEFFIRWQGVEAPRWIARRKAPPQARNLIDMYAAELRTREAQEGQRVAGQTRRPIPKGKKNTSRNGGAQEAEFYTVDYIVNHRGHNSKREYLVRWENYGASGDTWEKADKLRADVPDIVDAYEEQLQRELPRAEAVHSAMSELTRDCIKPTQKKRGVGSMSSEGSADKNKKSTNASPATGEHAKEKRQRTATETEEKNNSVNDDSSIEDDYQFDLEEAELEEFSDEEFADKLNS